MKKINHIYKSACLFGLLAVGLASCEDYLTVYPTDRVVEENFWEDLRDLEGVRYGAYRHMASTSERMFKWGDLRSDSYKLNTETHSEQDSHDELSNILMGMPDSSMSIFDWGPVYKTINLCNKVLKHGPEVLEKDKQFTTKEWIYMRAEMTALRALNYFYLIRAFKDVPYTTKIINSDAEVERFPLTNQMVVLDSIILDCEKVAGQARNRFSKESDTKGMITNAAIYSMLADMYLWRGSLHEGRNIKYDTVRVVKTDGSIDSIAHTPVGDYQLAVDWADKALEAHHNQIQEYFSSLTFGSSSYLQTVSYGLPNVDLIKNNFTGAHQVSLDLITSVDEVFFDGNSIESIFEIQYNQSDDMKNDVLHNLYGYSDRTNLMVAEDAIKEACGKDDKRYKCDTRVWVGCQNYISSTQAKSGYYCMKYQNPLFVFEGTGSARKISFATPIKSDKDSYYNWIVYRTPDVMLIKAEALAAAYGKQKQTEIFSILNAISRRSMCDIEEGQEPNIDGSGKYFSDITSIPADWTGKKSGTPKISGIIRLVMNQRQLELLGEGKRWFDLVRCAERICKNDQDSPDERENPEGVEKGEPGYVGNGMSGMSAVVECFMQNSVSNTYTTLINRFKNRWGLYCPIYEKEVKASRGAILQNPVWNKSRYEQ